LWLTKTVHSDLVLLDVPLPSERLAPVLEVGAPVESFYTTLLHTWMRALMVAFNLDENELNGFLAPGTDGEIPYRIVLYETSVGGSGVLASLAEPGRLELAVARARELLHGDEDEGDPKTHAEPDRSGGCERACYECLLSFYNQRDHHLLDRRSVLPWLRALEGLVLEALVDEDILTVLEAQCQSGLERQVLQAIHDRGLPLPDETQKTVYDGDAPIATVDFFYAPRILVFVDGSPHYRDYVQAADEHKRRRLKALGYRVVVVRAEDPEAGLSDLATRVR